MRLILGVAAAALVSALVCVMAATPEQSEGKRQRDARIHRG